MKPPVNSAGQPKRERLLFMGGWKSGKTYAHLSIAKLHQQRKSGATFFIIDTDHTINEMIGYPPFENLENVVYEEPEDWESLVDVTKRFRAKIRPGDWLVVDMISPCYEWVQQYSTREVFGQDKDILLAKAIAKQMVEKRLDSAAQANTGQALLDVVPWPVVKARYGPWSTSLISHPGHVIFVSGQKEIYAKEKGAAKEQFGGEGIKPDAQAYTGHLVNDVIWFRAPKPGEPPRLNTIGIGARGGRPVLKGESVKNFALDVLVRRYGWKL